MNKNNSILVLLLLLISNLFSQHKLDFVDNLKEHKTAAAYKQFSRESRAKLSKASFVKLWNSIISTKGVLKKVEFTCSNSQNSYIIEYYKLVFDKELLNLKLVLTDKKEVSGFFFAPYADCEKKNTETNKTSPSTTFKDYNLKNDTLDIFGVLSKTNKPSNYICIFIHGSGPNDKFSSIGPNKPFKDIAEGLKAAGIQSYLYDKRTLTNKEDIEKPTIYYESIDDVEIITNHFKKNFPNKKIVIIGHSLGGYLLPVILARNPFINSGIILNGNTISLEDKILQQTEYLFNSDGNIDSSDQAKLDLLKTDINRLKSSLAKNHIDSLSHFNLPTSYWKSLNSVDPKLYIKKVKQSLLIVHGERDYQVNADDLTIWKEHTSTKNNVTFKSYPKMNHILMDNTGTPSPNEYYSQLEISSDLINDLAKWIKAQ